MRTIRRPAAPVAAVAVSIAAATLLGGCARYSPESAYRPMLHGASAEAEFLRKSVSASAAQREWGRVALERSEDPAVRRLASRIVDDHRRIEGSTRAVAVRTGVALPARLAWADESTAARLAAMESDEFDGAYLDLVAADHSGFTRALAGQASGARDPHVRGLARGALPAVERHFEIARELRGDAPPR